MDSKPVISYHLGMSNNVKFSSLIPNLHNQKLLVLANYILSGLLSDYMDALVLNCSEVYPSLEHEPLESKERVALFCRILPNMLY